MVVDYGWAFPGTAHASLSQHHVLYLIEGKPEDVGTTPRDSCLKTIHRLTILYGFAVWRIKSLKETLIMWCGLLAEQKTLFKNIEDTVTTRIEDLSRMMAKTKKDVQTPRHYMLTFLQSVSGISSGMATAIAGESTSLQDFLEQCKKWEVVVEVSPRRLGYLKT